MEEQQAQRVLYHITARPNAELIRREGFDPWFCVQRSWASAPAAQALLRGERHDEMRERVERLEESPAIRARLAHNRLLDMERPRDASDALSHSCGSIFFFSSADEAVERVDRMTRIGTPYPLEILVVDGDKVPCECQEADSNLAHELYSAVRSNLPAAEHCAGLWRYAAFMDHDEQQAEYEDFCKRLHEIARQYYETMRPFDGTPRRDREILCPCRIPASAIVGAREI